jgi:hypothetical protein
LNIEIHNPALEHRVNEQIQNGHFQDMDELLEKALDALEQSTRAVQAIETGAAVLATLDARPYPDLDLTPPRVRLIMRETLCSDGMVARYQYPVGKKKTEAGAESNRLL